MSRREYNKLSVYKSCSRQALEAANVGKMEAKIIFNMSACIR
ncbi:MAG: hypothetical protein ACR5KW_00930 [Wolbachia sp.]